MRFLLACQPCNYYEFPAEAGLNQRLPCVKGGGTACRDGGIVKSDNLHKTIPQQQIRYANCGGVAYATLHRRQLPLHKGAFGLCAPKACLIFLTSTAFVDTKVKPRTRQRCEYPQLHFTNALPKVQFDF